MNHSILIAYFSRPGENYAPGGMVRLEVGHTARAAELLQRQTGGVLFEIAAAEPYPAEYRACVARSREELQANARPALRTYPERADVYDTVILAYPCWCGTMPMPVWTFLERYDFSGKTILPLCTNEGSGMGRSEADIRNLCPGAQVCPGLSVRGSEAEQAGDAIAAWLKANLDA